MNIDDLITMTNSELHAFVNENGDNPPQDFLPYVCLDGEEYAIAFDDDMADSACGRYIEDSVWAFNSAFLSDMTGLDIEVFDALTRSGLCEGANKAILSIINDTCGIDEFCEAAINADGRGHFLSPYDGEEIELACGGYAYRIN